MTEESLQDPRVLKTRCALRAALVELVETQGLDSITINDICRSAKITRATFYNHFRTKEEMISSFESDLLGELSGFGARMAEVNLLDLAGFRLTGRPLPLVVDLFSCLRAEASFLHAVLGSRGDASFASELRECFCTNMVRNAMHEKYRASSDPFVDYYITYFSSAVMGVIVRWIETGTQESPEEMAGIVMRLFALKPGESIKL